MTAPVHPLQVDPACLDGWGRLVRAAAELVALTDELRRRPGAHPVITDIVEAAHDVAEAMATVARDPLVDALGAADAYAAMVERGETRRLSRRLTAALNARMPLSGRRSAAGSGSSPRHPDTPPARERA